LDNATDVLQMMRGGGKVPNMWIYHSLMSGYMKERKMYQANQLFQMMMEDEPKGMVKDGLKPEAAIYTSLIWGFIETGMEANAMRVFRKMHEGGLEVQLSIYNALIYGLMENNMANEIVYTIQAMKSNGLKLRAASYRFMIGGCIKKNKMVEATQVLRHMKQDGRKLDQETYIPMINGLVKGGLILEAIEVLALMRGDGYYPSAELYGVVVNGCLGKGMINEAAKVAQMMNQDQQREKKNFGHQRMADIGKLLEVMKVTYGEVPVYTCLIIGWVVSDWCFFYLCLGIVGLLATRDNKK